LRPLVAALAAVLPLWAIAQSRVPTLPPPPVKTVPIPAASWRVYGSGSAAPVNTPNQYGGVDQKIDQSSTKAIYQWNSFDISSDSSVTFAMALRGSSALNRVIGSTAPSRIFGVLKATNGGEIYLINANGILFGPGAQVDVGSLTASALNITDDEFKSSLVNAISNPVPAFQYDGLAENFVDEKNFVRVDGGANIVTENGGRVFLFAKRVENAGAITTPGGQTVLAGGERVYLGLPTADSFAPLYAAESNPDVPILRGLVVEVGRGPSGVDGSALNDVSGHISAPRGNITIVGMAVNQNGRLSATTSVAENGSIILRAQGGAGPGTKQATDAGQLILGENSVTEILPDTQTDADGNELTSNDSAGFITSRVDLSGASVRLIEGTNIIAPGGEVNISAEVRPRYDSGIPRPYTAGDPLARIVIGADVLIDVSGTTDAQIDGERNFATTELLGSNDLRDAPLQKDGLLYRSKVTLDTRETSPILGDLSSYRSAEQRGIAERLSVGGSVSLIAQGGVVMRDTARIDLSGGQIRFSEAQVAPTMLMAEDGTMVDLNSAPADLVYVRAYNLQKASNADYDRWGLKVIYGGVLPGRLEPGYLQGQAAGSISIIAPNAVLDGELIAHTAPGQRQLEGEDAQAETGRFSLGAAVNGNQAFGSPSYAGAVLRDALLTDTTEPIDPAFWDAPMRNELPQDTVLSLQKLREGGFGHIGVTAQNDVTLDAGEGFEWADGGSLTLQSKLGDVSVSGDLRSAGSAVALRSLEGGVALTTGSSIDVSGRWVNQQLDGPTDSSSIQGGSVTLAGFGRVAMETGSLIDVSGGAVVAASGGITGGDAGAITIDASRALSSRSVSDATLQLGGSLQGYAIDNGGSLSITVPSVLVASRTAPADPLAPDVSLSLDPGFFRQGGFAGYSIDGVYSTFVATGTQIVAARNAYIAPAQPERIETGSRVSDVMRIGQPPLSPPLTVDVALSSSGNFAVGVIDQGGRLTFRPGAVLQTPDQSTVELSAAQTLRFNGEIVDKAGDVTLSTGTTSTVVSAPSFLWLGETSRIDVSGTVRLDPAATDAVRGEVLAGGNVVLRTANSVDDRASSLVWKQGGEIAAQGVQASLDVTSLGPAGVETRRETVASEGGSLTVIGNKDIFLEGELHAQGGSAATPGGRLSVSLIQGRDVGDPNFLPLDRELTITESTNTALSPATGNDIPAFDTLLGQASVSAELVRNAGVADVAISARERIVMDGLVTLAAPRSIQLQTRAIVVSPAGGDSAVVAPTVSLVQTAGQTGQDVSQIGDSRTPPDPTAGEGILQVHAQNIVIDGRIATQGIGSLRLEAQQDIRLQGLDPPQADDFLLDNALLTKAPITLAAQRIYPATGTTFTIDSNNNPVTIEYSGAAAPADMPPPLSAGGTLVIDAGSIEQQGALYAPQGRIELRSRSDITLVDGSITSVSGDGAVVPYGRAAIDGSAWYGPKVGNPTVDDVPLTAPPTKTIILDAQKGFVDAQAGAALNLSGGGELKAYSFVAGPGGSSDVFAGTDGAFAILPAAGSGLTPADASFTSQAVEPGREIVIGEGAPVPAGRYVLMPARYALLPGGFLVKPDDGGLPYALQSGTAIAQTNGSALIGAQIADAGTAYGPSTTGTWRITPSSVARKSSEIRDASATPFFTALAQDAGTVSPRLPIDAGGLTLSAAQANLAADIDFAGAAASEDGGAAGRGGDLQVVAERVRVVDSASAAPQPGELLLQAAQLSASGAATLLLGAERGGVEGTTDKLIVGAGEVVVDTPQTALRAETIVLAAQSEVTVTQGSKIEAVAGESAAEPNLLSVRGDGAAVLASAAPGSELQRTNTSLTAGRLDIGAGAAISAAAGTLVLDATGETVIDASSRIAASDITVSAPRLAVGEASALQASALAISTALLDQLATADALTLRTYQALQFADGASLDLGAGSRLTIDTPLIDASAADVAGAHLTAGTLGLENTTGSVAAPSPGSDGMLNLHALAGPPNPDEPDRGRIVIGNGEVRIAAGLTRVTADSQVALASGKGQLHADGALTIVTPAIAAVDSLASAIIDATGALSLLQQQVPAANPLPVQAEAGAALVLSGARVDIDTALTMPAGKVTVTAIGAAPSQGVSLQDGARIDAAGRQFVIDGTAVDVSAGTVTIESAAGSIALAEGALVDLSGIGLGAAGNLSLLAAQGDIVLDGSLHGFSGDTSSHPGGGLLPSGMGASLTIDSRSATDLAGVQASITDGDRTGFNRAISVRNREGDQTLAADVVLAAESIALQSDGGDLRISGQLDVSGAKGGRIELSSTGDLVLANGGELSAHAAAAGSEGGQVLMNAVVGEIRVEAGSRIDVAGTGAGGVGGTLQLRATRENAGAGQAGDEVRIASIGGEVLGARRIDVEAVKIYEGSTILPPDVPPPVRSSAEADGRVYSSEFTTEGVAFLGADGANATAIATRLSAGNPTIAATMRVHPGAEVRSTGDLAYDGATSSLDWYLKPESVDSSAVSANTGDTSVTLRAAGNVVLSNGLVSGFDSLFGPLPTSSASGDIRVVAGADLKAASPMSVVRGGEGSVQLGRFTGFGAQPTLVASTTGDIRIAAAGDVDMQTYGTAVFTVGRAAADEASAAAIAGIDAGDNTRGSFAITFDPDTGDFDVPVSPFRVDGGSIDIAAGGSVRGDVFVGRSIDGSGELSPADWRVVRPYTAEDGSNAVAWWTHLPGTTVFSDYTGDLRSNAQKPIFETGVATLGGGDVRVQAGRDVLNLGASAAGSGVVSGTAEDGKQTVYRYGGGDVFVQAGRDVVNGQFSAAGDTLRVSAGRDILSQTQLKYVRDEQVSGFSVYHENTAVDIAARRDVDMVSSTTLFGVDGQWISGLDGDASLRVVAAGGSLTYAPRTTPEIDFVAGDANLLIAPYAVIAAPQGPLSLDGAVIQQPVNDASLRFLSEGDLTTTANASIGVNATRGSDLGVDFVRPNRDSWNPVPVTQDGEELSIVLEEQQLLGDHGSRLDRSSRTPVQFASQQGSVLLGAPLASARPVRVVAAGDIGLPPGDNGTAIGIQHQTERWDPASGTYVPTSELTLFQAGEAIRFGLGTKLSQAGAGDLVLIAGDDINLGSGNDGGIDAVGNNLNATLLPEGSANITLVAGLRADGQDYEQAVLKGFHALGGLGLADRAGDLYALLSSDEPTVALGSSSARSFDAASLDSRLSQSRTLVGDEAYNASIATYVRSLPGNEGLSEAAALARFDTLSSSLRDPAPGLVLADAFGAQDAARRSTFVTQVAQAGGDTLYGSELVQYMQRISGGQTFDLAGAVAAFEALPLERQVPLLNQNLVLDLRTNGRAAAGSSDDAVAANAYARGYRSVESLFPAERPGGSIISTTSRIRTEQGNEQAPQDNGNITLMAPGGAVNAGETLTQTQDPQSLGFVTVGGGDISSVVQDEFLVNRSRVFTLREGDILIWSSRGDIDAGRGAKTVVGAPAPVLRLTADGRLVLDTSGSFTGSGIAVLDAKSELDLYAPQGAIDAGEAGIRASGNAFFGAQVIRGADNLQIGGNAVGAPPPPPTVGSTAGLTGASQDAANRAAAGASDDEDERRKRRARRTLLLEFLGFGNRG
jgi:filamentous hemagglutinin family protein